MILFFTVIQFFQTEKYLAMNKDYAIYSNKSQAVKLRCRPRIQEGEKLDLDAADIFGNIFFQYLGG